MFAFFITICNVDFLMNFHNRKLSDGTFFVDHLLIFFFRDSIKSSRKYLCDFYDKVFHFNSSCDASCAGYSVMCFRLSNLIIISFPWLVRCLCFAPFLQLEHRRQAEANFQSAKAWL